MNDYILKPLIIFVFLTLIFVMQSITVEIADKKGFNKYVAGILFFIPMIIMPFVRVDHIVTLILPFVRVNHIVLLIIIYGIIILIPIGILLIYIFRRTEKRMAKASILKALSIKEILLKSVIYGELIIVATIIIIPIIYIIGASLNKAGSLPITIWPSSKNFSWNNYTELLWGKDNFITGPFLDVFKENLRNLFFGQDVKPTWNIANIHINWSKLKIKWDNPFFINQRADFVKWYFNTLGIAVINMIIGVIFITGAAYVFARFKFKGKKAGLVTILVLQVFPSFMGLVAMYVLFETFNLLGKPLALSILYIGGSIPYNMWVIKGFLLNIPKELDESAMIDGANKLQIFFKIILPLSVPILSFVAVSMFMAPWMDYMLPQFLLNVDVKGAGKAIDRWTIAVGLFEFIKGTNSEFTKFAAGAVIVAFPITILYMIFQRYLVEGITAGSTKG